MTTTEATKCTDEQRAEWFALHDRAKHLARQYDQALQDAGQALKWGIQHDDLDSAHRRAEECAHQAIAFWAEREKVVAEIEAHPFEVAREK